MPGPTFDEAKDLLAERLRALNAVGTDGFEGLMRDVLSEITGQLFRLAKSGPQGGSDVRTIGHNTIHIGLEGKRYGAGTTLRLDELQAKVVDAAKQQDPVDLWVLAATREITATDVEGLEQTGRDHGITVLVLDWPSRSGALPDLVAMCLEAPHAVQSHFQPDKKLSSAIAAIKRHADYVSFSDRLKRRLLAPDIGYAAAAETMQKWIMGGLHSEANSAARLGGRFNNLLDTRVKRVARVSLNQQLDNWLKDCRPAALIGDEGVGKTWSFLSWWLMQVEMGKQLPLTIFVSAKEVQDENVEDLIVRLLTKRLELRDKEFWMRRLRQWLCAEFAAPQVLLVIDGLNQNWLKNDWADFLQPLFQENWAKRFAVLITCWPNHWKDLHHLTPLTPEPHLIEVKPFDDPELDELLALHGLMRNHFSRDVIELMKVPRLSLLAITERSALAESGDTTSERLAYEDWKHRVRRRGTSLAISDEEFHEFIRGLGSSLRNSIDDAVFTSRDIFERLGKDSGKGRADLLGTVGELIAGRWLQAGEKPNHFRVNKDLIPFALGLVLADELKTENEDVAAAITVANFIDPFKGQSLGVAILRATVTICLLDANVGRPARRVILKRWLSEQNFSHADFESYWRLIGLDVELVCQVTEETRLARIGGGSFTDEIMIKGLVNAYEFPEVGPRLVSRVTTWLGWLWENPDEGRFIGKVDPTSTRSEKNIQRTQGNFAEWLKSDISAQYPFVEVAPAGDASWLSHRVFGILSFLPHKPFINAFLAWGISRAIMGVPRHDDELSWVLRLNEKDPESFGPAFLDAIEKLQTPNQTILTKAASSLLQAFATRETEARLKIIRALDSSEKKTYSKAVPELNPLDPSSQLLAEHISENIDGSTLWSQNRQIGNPDLRFEQLKTYLARLAPQRLRDIIGEAAVSAPTRSDAELLGLLRQLHRILLALKPNERQALIVATDRTIGEGKITEPNELAWWRMHRLELRLWDVPEKDRLKILQGEGLDLHAHIEPSKVLMRLDQASLHHLLDGLPLTGDQELVLGTLRYLCAIADDNTLKSCLGSAEFLSSEDDSIRRAALELVSSIYDPIVMETVAASGWKSEGVKDRSERIHGSIALLSASEVLQRPELVERADREIIAIQLSRHPDSTSALRDYDIFVREEINNLLLKQATRVLGDSWARHDKSMRILLIKSPGFLQWFDLWLHEHNEIPNTALYDEFPLITLCYALIETSPALGVNLWRKLNHAMSEGIIKNRKLRFLPMAAPPGKDSGAGREEVLALSILDQDLADLAQAALEGDNANWLEKTIRDGESTDRVDHIARAYTLLGFSDATPKFEAIWLEFEQRKPTDGWLADVYHKSYTAFLRNQWARHWYRAYLSANDPIDAFANYELLIDAVDGRARLWISKRELRTMTYMLRKHWDANIDTLNKSIKRKREDLKDRLFWTKTMSRTQWPWL